MKTAILMPCWRSSELLKISIPSLKAAASEGDEIIVILNEADPASIDYLNKQGILHIDSETNWGPSGVDLAMLYIQEKEFDYVANVNSDMLFSRGWTKELIDLLEANYPCTASACLVEPSYNPICVYENLGDFTTLDPSVFQSNIDAGKYRPAPMVASYNHPILCRAKDFIDVKGYSDDMDEDWVRLFGKCLDDHFAHRLLQLHVGSFRFLRSDKAFVYHGIGINSSKTGQGRHNGPEVFRNKTGMSLPEFHALTGV